MASVWRSPHLWWRIAIIAVCTIGLMGGDRPLAFYTTQSNVIVVAFFAVTVYVMVSRRTTATPAPRLRGGVTLWIVVTGLVSHVVLNDGADPLPGLFVPDADAAVQNQTLFLLHYVAPVMVLLDWIVFGPHGIVRWRDAAAWMLYPLAYAVLAIVRGLVFPFVSDRFPYPFLDIEALGTGIVGSLVSVVVMVAFVAVVVIVLDRLSALVARRLGIDAPAEEPQTADV